MRAAAVLRSPDRRLFPLRAAVQAAAAASRRDRQVFAADLRTGYKYRVIRRVDAAPDSIDFARHQPKQKLVVLLLAGQKQSSSLIHT